VWQEIERKVLNGERLNAQEGLYLLKDADLLPLGSLAQEARFRRHPEPHVTFVIDSNPNYTNICDTDCLFCAFYRKPGASDGYWLTVPQVLEKIGAAVEQGATTVLLQGGHNPEIPFDYYLDLVRETRRRFPRVTPHFFTASEIQAMARYFGKPVREILAALGEAGQRSLPGGGAEILSKRVRQRIAAKKGVPEEWIEVHREAHRLGWRSTATMMYGHVETPEDILAHWNYIRNLQDETGGFTAFVPWSFKPTHTHLSKWVAAGVGPNRYLRMIAASRLYLDNFAHIQASWFSEGKKTGQVALHFGADDFGGTLIEENVHAAAAFTNKTTTDETIAIIREAGFIPAQRTTLYEILRVYDEAAEPVSGSARGENA
jgi:cyclic dehypoxanthinyl futalosine synthase